jgi:hypothetical protein
MGTIIDLTIDGLELCWSKNSMGIDFGPLFQKGDQARRRSDQVDYASAEADDEEPFDAAFVRPLGRTLPRLNLLGADIEAARAGYEAAVSQAVETARNITSVSLPTEFMSFAEFCAFCSRYPLSSLDTRRIPPGLEGEETTPPGRFAAHADEVRRIPAEPDYYPWMREEGQSEKSFFASTAMILDPYPMMQVLGHNGANADAKIVWLYGPLVKNGWEKASSFVPGIGRYSTILVATEGTSDARIIKRALDVLRPDVADFFRFIDVNENHPFWGTGSLVKFAEGLVRIDVQNSILFLLDNDAEGQDAYHRLQGLDMPSNMRAMVLPDHEAFRNFPAYGPQGISTADINGRAAAIECYLDLELPSYGPAQIVWSNYKKNVDAWHGALEYKESYAKHFFQRTDAELAGKGYHTEKLERVLDVLIAEASILASGKR